jgi:crotonobetainyl-CoA:carnitine CoA-transferase CaiB-like acyl-CoA transferase
VVEPITRGAGPLDGIRVLDFSRVLSGPHCGRMLADLGADVIKIEPPEGDLTRYTHPRVNSMASYYAQQNCGKRNISLDLKHPRAPDLILGLVGSSDVVIENFRPGVMARMGLGFDALAAVRPSLVYLSISGYGQDGPWAQRRAYAPVVGAESGITWMQGQARRGEYANDVMSHGDTYTSLEGLAGVLAALYQRTFTGVGQHIDVSMAETMLSVNEHLHWEVLGREADGFVASFEPQDYPVVVAGDGQRVVLSGHPAERGTFELYVAGLDRPELLDDPRFADVATRLRHLDELQAELAVGAARFADAGALEASLARHGLAMGHLRTVQEVADSDWAKARGAVVEVSDRAGGAIRIPNSPWHFGAADSGVRGQPAYRGEHNREVLSELCALSATEIDELEAAGVLSSRLPT